MLLTVSAVFTVATVEGNSPNTATGVKTAMLSVYCANSVLAVNNYNMQQHNQQPTNLITFKTY